MRINATALPWAILIALLAAGLLVALVYFIPGKAGDTNGDFAKVRSALNEQLRQTLASMGIDPRERAVIESRDKMIEEGYSWSVLNWRVRIDPDFDLPYARRRLESTIRSLDGRHTSYWNYDDEVLPLKIEAFVEDRLSHRIFFTVERPTAEEPPAPTAGFSPSKFIKQRWNILSGSRLELDRELQNVLASLEVSETPLVISEYWRRQSAPMACWVVNISKNTDVNILRQQLAQSIESGEITEANIQRPKGVALALDVKQGPMISHRIYFSTKPVSRGLSLRNGDHAGESVFIMPPRVALIIDDIGYDTKAAEKLMSLGVPITLSILPHRPFSTEIALRARQRKFETMLHMPMEPVAYPQTDPGAGRILVNYDLATKKRLAAESIKSVPYVAGVNNHMGSRAMGDAQTVQSVLDAVKKNNLYFVDSRTRGDTLGYTMARDQNIPVAERSVFLDSVNRSDIDYCTERLREVITLAKAHGSCVAIGHPHKGTIEAISRLIEEFGREGIELVFASDLVS